MLFVQALQFNNHQLWKVNLQNLDQQQALSALEDKQFVDLWNPLHRGDVLLRVMPETMPMVQSVLNQHRIEKQVIQEDLQEWIDQEQEDQSLQHPLMQKGFFTKYHTLDEIQEFYGQLVTDYPDLAKPFTIGQSFQKRDVKGIHIGNGTTKYELFFHGGIHAREWIGPATVTYIANELLSQFGKDERVTHLLNQFTVSIVPVANVDGYIYSHEENRMWRKNRQPSNFFCVGIDINRNFDYGWSKPGASGNPCSDSYYGPKAFASPEAVNIASYIQKAQPISYIDFHAFSQLWMYPYGVECDSVPPTANKMHAVASKASKALKDVHGTSFTVGPICKVIYQASGSSIDWAYALGNVSYPYAVELRDTGKYGFLLPPKYIIPSGEETYQGVLGLLEGILKEEQ
ncbi:hypothetical protein EDD86DRAFT_225637 [Gorgonomyces haynaldii]|nr:hypothetical protein EDD86DRAFT_225637 [Gorgonomyces haynaldii]